MQRKTQHNHNKTSGNLVIKEIKDPQYASQTHYDLPNDTVIDFVYFNKNCLQLFLNHTTTPDASAAVWKLLEKHKIMANLSQFMQLKQLQSGQKQLQPCFHVNVLLPKDCEKTFTQAIELLKQANLFSRFHFIANNVIAKALVTEFEDYCLQHPGPQDDDVGEIISTQAGPKVKSWCAETAQDVERKSLANMRKTVNELVGKCVETDLVGFFPTPRGNIDIVPSDAAKMKNCEMIASQLNTVTAINPNWKVAYKDGRAYCYLLCESAEQRNAIYNHFAAHNQADQQLKPLKLAGQSNVTLGTINTAFTIEKKADARDNSKHYVVINDNFVNANVVLKILFKQISMLNTIPKETKQPKIDEITQNLTNLKITSAQPETTQEEVNPRPRIWDADSDNDDEDQSAKTGFGI